LVVCDQLRDPNSDQHRSKVVRARLRARISPPGSIQVDLCVGSLDGEEDERDEEQEEADAPGLAFGPTSAMSCAVRTRENVRNMETNGGMIKSQPKVTASTEIRDFV
jgi:hypothetical protein